MEYRTKFPVYSVFAMIEWLCYEHWTYNGIINLHIFWFNIKSHFDASILKNENEEYILISNNALLSHCENLPSLCEDEYKAMTYASAVLQNKNTQTFPMESTIWKSLMWAQKLPICTYNKGEFKAMHLFSPSFHWIHELLTKYDVLSEFHVAAPKLKSLYCCISVFVTLTTFSRWEWDKHPDVYCFSCFHFCWGAFAFFSLYFGLFAHSDEMFCCSPAMQFVCIFVVYCPLWNNILTSIQICGLKCFKIAQYCGTGRVPPGILTDA